MLALFLFLPLIQEALEASLVPVAGGDLPHGGGIGPQGLGGKTTALAVNIEYLPTHIAGLPVAVNLNCHVTRHKSEVL